VGPRASVDAVTRKIRTSTKNNNGDDGSDDKGDDDNDNDERTLLDFQYLL